MTPLITKEEYTQPACTSEPKRFFFEENAVGCFEDQLPSSPGQYRYTQLRGPGHLRLLDMSASTGAQRCYYLLGGERHYFIVIKALNNDVLLVHAHAPVTSMSN